MSLSFWEWLMSLDPSENDIAFDAQSNAGRECCESLSPAAFIKHFITVHQDAGELAVDAAILTCADFLQERSARQAGQQ